MKNLPTDFWLYLFESYCDSSDYNSRYGKYNDGAEYGISAVEFMEFHAEDAIADGKDIWAESGRKADLYAGWKKMLSERIKAYQRMLDTDYKVL
jgi:hypothetical protein